MRTATLLILLLLWRQESVRSVRLLEVRIPAHAPAGGELILGCQYELEGDELYTVKWYKDGHEFYRYVPRDEDPIIYFHTPGVTVNKARSSSEVVTIRKLSPESSGVYRCEVTGEAPLFTTVGDQKYLSIHVLPEKDPEITGLHDQYSVGEELVANCTSSASQPAARMTWLINNRPAHMTQVIGPLYKSVDTWKQYNLTEATLQLNLVLREDHFINGVMKIKCQATIAPLYHKEVTYRVMRVGMPFYFPSQSDLHQTDHENQDGAENTIETDNNPTTQHTRTDDINDPGELSGHGTSLTESVTAMILVFVMQLIFSFI